MIRRLGVWEKMRAGDYKIVKTHNLCVSIPGTAGTWEMM
jgi:hypothetical protein